LTLGPASNALEINLDCARQVKPMMFELIILSVIFFAAAYAAFLWWEGRRDDVLFGAFVEKSSVEQVEEVR
jgi:hypothetical protein